MDKLIESLLGTATINREVAQKMAATAAMLPSKDHQLFARILEKQLAICIGDWELGRVAFKELLPQVYPEITPLYAAAMLAVYGRCTINAAKVSDAAVLLEQLQTKLAQAKAAEDTKQYLKENAATMTSDAAKAIVADMKLGISPVEQKGVSVDFTLPTSIADQMPEYIRNLATHLGMTTGGKVDAKHIMLAIAIYGAVVGKRAKFANWGLDYYPNLATIILAPSGSGKSNLKGLAAKLLRDSDIEVSEHTTATAEGIIAQYAERVTGVKDAQERRDKIREAAQKTRNQPGVTLLCDELLALTGSIIKKDEATKYSRLLCKLLDNDIIQTATKTDGVAVWADQCVNLIALSQVESFNENLRSAEFKEAGLSGRLIPVNDTILKMSMTPTDGIAHCDLAKMLEYLNDSPSIGVHFGEGDPLGKAMAKVEQLADSQLRGIYDSDWKQLRSKILIQGAKVATIYAVANWVQKAKGKPDWLAEKVTLDASEYICPAMALVYYCHASNLFFIATVGEDVERLRQLFTRLGALSEAQIHAYTKWDQWKIRQVVAMGVDAALFTKVKGKKAAKYQLIA